MKLQSVHWVIFGPGLALLAVEVLQPEPLFSIPPFLVAVFFISFFHGYWPAIRATLFSTFLLDFFVTPPLYRIGFDQEDLMTDVGFILAAIMTAMIAAISKYID